MRFEVYLVAITSFFATNAIARKHTYCACQGGSDQGIHVYATQRVHDNNQNMLKWAQDAPGIWYGHDKGAGPRFGGSFMMRKDGRQEIDGDWIHDQCRLYGGGDSTCFECSRVQMNGNDKLCTKT